MLRSAATRLSRAPPEISAEHSHRCVVSRFQSLGSGRLGEATFHPATGPSYLLDDATIVRVPVHGGAPGTPERISLKGLGARLQGLALKPSDGLFYVAGPSVDLIYAVDASGVVGETYSLASRAPAFAPSSDPTDDPATQHMLIADAGGSSTFGGVAEVALADAGILG